MLVPLALLLSPLERRGRPADAPVPAAARQIGGAAGFCLGVALLALYGFGDEPADWVDVAAFACVFVGASAGGLLPKLR